MLDTRLDLVEARAMYAHITDPEQYEDFKVAAAKAIEEHGGRYLVRGGASTAVEGEFRSRAGGRRTTSDTATLGLPSGA